MNRIRRYLLASLVLMSLTTPSVAVTISEALKNETLTVYLFDEGGFMEGLKYKGFTVNYEIEGDRHFIYSEPGKSLLRLVQKSSEGLVEYYDISRVRAEQHPDMDSDEQYRLVVLKQPSTRFPDETLTLDHRDGTWWASQAESTLTRSSSAHVIANGMLSTLNLGHAKQAQPYQVMEMLGGVARQAPLLRELDHPNIIKPRYFKAGENQLPLTLIPDGNYYQKLESGSITLTELIKGMTAMAEAMAYLHHHEVAHGDIKLASVKVFGEKTVLADFERFSLLNQASGPRQIGTKKFLFYNNEFHAPELRYPNGLDKTWQYTTATKEGDIWSFGMMLASALYHIPESHDAIKATALGHQQLWQYLGMNEEEFEERYNGLNGKARDRQLGLVPIPWHFRKSQINLDNFAAQPSSVQSGVIEELVALIAACTERNPVSRPVAGEVVQKLRQLRP